MRTREVRVSARCARELVNGCQYDYIVNCCKGACCCLSDRENNRVASPAEEEALRALGYADQLRDAGSFKVLARGCAFRDSLTGLCALHKPGLKPLTCRLAPFSLNDNLTLIFTQRSRRLRCYHADPLLLAYRAYRASFVALFGEYETERITQHLDAGGGDVGAPVESDRVDTILRVRALRRGELDEPLPPQMTLW